MRRLAAIELIAVACLAVASGLGYGRVFMGRSYLGPVLGAGAAAVAVAGLAAWRRLGAPASLALSGLAYSVWVTYLVLADTAPNGLPTLATLRELGAGVTQGWAELLTVTLPAEASPRLLVVGVTLTWLAGAVGSALAVSRVSAAVPAVPGLVAFGASLLFRADEPRLGLVSIGAVAAAALAVVLVHSNRELRRDPAAVSSGRRPQGGWREPASELSVERQLVAGAPVIAVAVAAALALAVALPATGVGRPFNPRTLREVEVEPRRALSPLVGFKTQLGLEPKHAVFTLRAEAADGTFNAEAAPRVRLAVLDVYDGAAWTSSARYANVGSTFPVDRDLALAPQRIVQEIEIAKLDGGWLPAVERPASLRLLRPATDTVVRVDAASGMLLADERRLDGFEYELDSYAPAVPSEAQLMAAAAAEDVDAVELPELPPEITQLARQVTLDAEPPYERLSRLQQFFTDGFGYSKDADAGHSVGRLKEFLFESRTGYAEQFATAFAVMARSIGLPTRIAVGYRTKDAEVLDDDQGRELLQVSTSDAHVWPEVRLAGLGWVAFEPTPSRTAPAPSRPEPPQLPSGGFVEQRVAPPTQADGGGSSGVEERRGSSGRLLFLLMVGLAALGAVLAVVAVKQARRGLRRRRARTATDHILGAWADAVDRLVELGAAVPSSMTAREVATASAKTVGPAASARLEVMAPLVTNTVFAPSEPDEEWIEEMWGHAAAFRKEAFAGRSKLVEIGAWLSPRPLLPRRRGASAPSEPVLSGHGRAGPPRP
ncbi:MAG: transglutaminase-like domain-containing protein [Acidimicrobiales bacterium]